MIIEIKSEKQFQETITKNKIVLADFYASWCGPCRMQGLVLDDVAKTRKDVTWIKINVDENLTLAQKYQVSSIPHVFLFVNGDKKAEFTGAKAKDQLNLFIDKNLK